MTSEVSRTAVHSATVVTPPLWSSQNNRGALSQHVITGASGTTSIAVLFHNTSRLARVALRQSPCSVTTCHKRRKWHHVNRGALSQHVTTGAGGTASVAVLCHNTSQEARVTPRQSPCPVPTCLQRRRWHCVSRRPLSQQQAQVARRQLP